ncbi:sugar phosphate isomerase/epimerase family protein [Caballeronia humi]|jgi:sugar phosphate isomerase/epimerase|uniref:AP endonuclease, family 2 domain protein n=1 Tax=Caballeronia humi TaxID=326474 RepID=A0A158GC66_9BURK|nr:sugar phosphate isomerase/epimerase family protein [Caballeronia humi]SAL29219.1 AP endonuclease, family 2 domain protein [Caballeronia humi]
METLQGRLDRCSINTATLGHREPLGVTIDRIARAGFGGIAPWRHEVEAGDARQLAKQIQAHGLTVTGYCRSTYLPAATRREFEANIASNKAALNDAAELNARCFVMVVGGMPEGSRDLDAARAQVSEGVAELLETARRVGVPLALEPLHPMYAANRSVLNTIAQALEMCERIDPQGASGALGVAIDIYHCWWDPHLLQSIGAAGKARRILAYHVSDWLRETSDMLLDRGMMGDGVVDLRALRGCVEAAGFKEHVEVEIFSARNWWRRDPDEVLLTCARRLQDVC